MKRKRILQIAAALLGFMMLFAMTACSPGESKPTGSTPSGSSDPVTPEEPIVLSFLHVFTGARAEALDKIVQGFNESQDRIIVEHEHAAGWYSGLLEQLQTLAVAKQLPDITIMGLSNHNFMLQELNAVSMTPYIEADNFDMSPYFPGMLSLGLGSNGEQYGMPFAVSTPLLYANIDLLESVGLTYVDQPDSWEEIRSWAKAVADGTDADGVAFQLDFDTWQFQMLLETYGGKMADVDKKEILFNGEAGQKVMDLWMKMKFEDGSWPNMTGDEAAENFLNGDLAMITATTGNLTAFTKDANFNMGIMLLPLYDDAAHSNARQIPAGGSNLYIMPTDEARQQASWEFIKYALSLESGAIIVEGMGYMAAHQGLLEENGPLTDYLTTNPQATRSYDQVVDLTDWFNWPGVTGPRIDDVFLTSFAEAFLKQQDGKEALDGIAAQVKDILGW